MKISAAPPKVLGGINQAYKLRPDNAKIDPSIPGDLGMPIFGQTFRALFNLESFLRDQYARFGPVSRTYIGNQHSIMALGPELNQQILLDRNRDFSSEMGYERSMGPFFGGGIMLRDFDEHRAQRRIMQSAFKTDALKGYIQEMNHSFSEDLADWGQRANFRFHKLIKPLLLRIAAKIFIGVPDMGADLKRMNDAFLDTVGGLQRVIRRPWPGTSYRRGLRGRAYLYKYFQSMLPAKRQGGDADMFSRFAQERDEHGELFSDHDVITHIIFLMMAAHDTTTSALTSMAFELGAHPEWQNQLREESLALGKASLDYEDLERLESLDLFFREMLRLHSPVPMSSRRTVREVSLGDHVIPADTIVNIAPTFSHHMREWWDEPEQFDPMRFAAGREEHKRHSFSYVPFGGGAHKCIGMHFAAMQSKAFIHQFLLRFDIELLPGYIERVRYQQLPFPFPRDHLPLILRLRKNV